MKVGWSSPVDKPEYVWVSGTDPAKLAPGRYWTTNTGRAWAISTSTCTSGCESANLYLAPCMKVGSTLTVSDAEVVTEPPKISASLPFSTTEAFDLEKETANVQLGLCAKRAPVGVGDDSMVANVYSIVMPQLK